MLGNVFLPINSTETSVYWQTTAASQTFALETTSRFWDKGASNRAIRIASLNSAVDFYVAFGSSTISADVATSAIQILGGGVDIFAIEPSHKYLATASSTNGTFSVTLGRMV